MGDVFQIEGMAGLVPMGLLAAAGKEPAKITTDGVTFEELWRSGWDLGTAVADQDQDGVGAELIYPTVGMLICNHPDFDFKKACFEAYESVGWANTAPRRRSGCWAWLRCRCGRRRTGWPNCTRSRRPGSRA